MNRTTTIVGVRVKNTHSGQKKAYGDSFYEYEVTSNRPADEVETICAEHVYKAIPEKKYLEEYRAKPSADLHFRAHYKFKALPDGSYFYSVCFPYAD